MVTTKDMIMFFIPHLRTISKSQTMEDKAIISVDVTFFRWFGFTRPVRVVSTVDYSNVDFDGEDE